MQLDAQPPSHYGVRIREFSPLVLERSQRTRASRALAEDCRTGKPRKIHDGGHEGEARWNPGLERAYGREPA